MKILIAAVVILLLFSLEICVLLKKRRHIENEKEINNVVAWLLSLDMTMVISGLVVDGTFGFRLLFDLSVAAVPATLCVFQAFNRVNRSVVVSWSFFVIGTVILLHLLAALDFIEPASKSFFLWSSLAIILFLCAIITGMTFRRLFNVHRIMKSGSLWSYLWMCSDFIYMGVIAAIVLLAVYFKDVSIGVVELYMGLSSVFLTSAVCALYLRGMRSSPFIILKRHERVVVETMKTSRAVMLESCDSEETGYRDVFRRLSEYFESEKPFLRSDLTINDMVKVIYSNKLYISRAVSLCTGRNFRQFVNSYRIRHSCDVYRANPNLKIVDLAQACGFNTVASYNMAFRLFMKETPGEWCRKEKARISLVNKQVSQPLS